jgi:hypothetical protein
VSVERITTHVVRCDFLGCDESYADVVPVAYDAILEFAKRDGWVERDDSHYCPTHAAAEAHELA